MLFFVLRMVGHISTKFGRSIYMGRGLKYVQIVRVLWGEGDFGVGPTTSELDCFHVFFNTFVFLKMVVGILTKFGLEKSMMKGLKVVQMVGVPNHLLGTFVLRMVGQISQPF